MYFWLNMNKVFKSLHASSNPDHNSIILIIHEHTLWYTCRPRILDFMFDGIGLMKVSRFYFLGNEVD